MIDICNLTRRRGDATVVDGLTFRAEPGSVIGFLGPNGAGKTTTMRLLLGLETVTAGSATFDAVGYHDLVDPIRTVGALLDASWAHPRRTGRTHLRWLAAAAGLAARRVDEVLDVVGLASVAGRRVGTYSLGMRQRLGLASALLGDPAHLVLDEPANGLDPHGIAWLRSLLRRQADRGCTVIVSSHLLDEVAQTADHLVVISNGRKVADTTPDDLTRPGITLEQAYLDLTGDGRSFVASSGA